MSDPSSSSGNSLGQDADSEDVGSEATAIASSAGAESGSRRDSETENIFDPDADPIETGSTPEDAEDEQGPDELAQTAISAQTLLASVGRRLIEKPPAGMIEVIETAGLDEIEFAFVLEDIRVMVLDIDVVLVFPDGAKIVLPGLALDVVTSDPPQMRFADLDITSDTFVSRIGEINLSEDLPQLQLASSRQVEGSAAENSASGVGAEGEAESETVGETAPTGDRGATDGVATERATQIERLDPRGPGVSNAPENLVFDPLFEAAVVATSFANVLNQPVADPTLIDDSIGNVIGADLDITVFGLAGQFSRQNAGGGLDVFGGASTENALSDPTLAAQLAPEVISASALDDVIFAEDPARMQSGTSARTLDTRVELTEERWTPVSARVINLPEGFSILNGRQDGTGFVVDLSDSDPFNLALELAFVLPDDSVEADENGDFDAFSLSIQFTVDLGDGTQTTTVGTANFAISDVQTDQDLVRVNEGGEVTYVLPRTPAVNVIDSGAGDDLIYAGAGIDTVTGGAGSDTLSYLYSNSAVSLDLAAGTASRGYARGDIFTGIENLEGSRFDDVLTGDAGDNVFSGLAGADTISGGGGTDRVTYVASEAAVTVDLGLGTGTGGDAEGDVLNSIEDLVGSNFEDRLIGSDASNSIRGGDGRDEIFGRAGDDELLGGDDDDTLHGGAGADILSGGDGFDTASYENATGGVASSLLGTPGTGGEATGDILTGIERIVGSAFDDDLSGSFLADTLEGGAGNDTLTGLTGADTLRGGAGDDVIDGGAGADTIDGGAGRDQLTYAFSQEAVEVDLRSGDVSGGDATGDTISNIEDVTGTAFNDDLTGSSVANRLDGGDGDDRLAGGLGADQLIGGSGTDTVDYGQSAGGIALNLEAGTATGGDAEGDTFSGIEVFRGSGLNDTLAGSSGIDVFFGAGGNDSLSGSLGDDQLDGGTGDDFLDGGAGADSLVGGSGSDTASYAFSNDAVYIDLENQIVSGGEADGDTFSSIENVTGSAFNDTLIGDDAVNVLTGGAGADRLQGGRGGDTLDGGDGVDVADYSGSTASVTVNLATATGSSGTAQGDILRNIENVIGSSSADLLIGDDGVNQLEGGGGDDVLRGGVGADTLIGGDGADIADYSDAGTSVTASIEAGGGLFGEAAGDSYTSIEGLAGSQFGDTLTGDSGANRLVGGAGDDTLIGLGGGDTIEGGLGTDTISYERSSSAVTVDLTAGRGFNGDADGDVISGVEDVIGSNFDDTLTGNAADNRLTGGDGSDTLVGRAGDDRLDGGAGNDVLIGGAGADILVGGGGVDTASYATDTAGVTVDLDTRSANGG
ncbi:MAG: calcium-binding protein, partial [Pseudomonadota bacterium]